MDDVYEVRVSGPDGSVRVVVLTKEQVEFFAGEPNVRPYATALWLAYCDIWTQEDE